MLEEIPAMDFMYDVLSDGITGLVGFSERKCSTVNTTIGSNDAFANFGLVNLPPSHIQSIDHFKTIGQCTSNCNFQFKIVSTHNYQHVICGLQGR